MASVQLKNVSRIYGSAKAVDDLSLEIKSGEFVTLLGPSGCGKTTTLRMVAGLEKNTGGRINIGENVVSDADKGYFVPSERRRLGMVFQSYAIWPHMTVFENVAYPLRIRRLPSAGIRERVGRALCLVEMESYAERPSPALSGGQQQRVAIARSLVFEPEVLLLDEPLSNLDARLRIQMGDEFRQLQQRLKITTLYVTHDQSEAMALSDRVVVMQEGKILQAAAPEEIYHRPLNRKVAAFFGSPNLLPAKVKKCVSSDTRFMLSVEGDGWAGDCQAAVARPEGSAVTVIIRPENLRLGEPQEKFRRSEMGRKSGPIYFPRASTFHYSEDLRTVAQHGIPFGGRNSHGQYDQSFRSKVGGVGGRRLIGHATQSARLF